MDIILSVEMTTVIRDTAFSAGIGNDTRREFSHIHIRHIQLSSGFGRSINIALKLVLFNPLASRVITTRRNRRTDKCFRAFTSNLADIIGYVR